MANTEDEAGMDEAAGEATRLLTRHVAGDGNAASELLPLVYDQLRKRAARLMRHERAGHTLSPTALVHEAYLRLIDGEKVDWRGKTHFFAVAAMCLKRVLIDYARGRQAMKRGVEPKRVTLSKVDVCESPHPLDMLQFCEVLSKLAKQSPRQCRVVELQYFAGLGVKETADILDVSERTVKRDWAFAWAWLLREMEQDVTTS